MKINSSKGKQRVEYSYDGGDLEVTTGDDLTVTVADDTTLNLGDDTTVDTEGNITYQLAPLTDVANDTDYDHNTSGTTITFQRGDGAASGTLSLHCDEIDLTVDGDTATIADYGRKAASNIHRMIIGISGRVTTAIETAANWSLALGGDDIVTGQAIAAGTTFDHSDLALTLPYFPDGDDDLVLTATSGTAGVVHVTIWYLTVSAPTS